MLDPYVEQFWEKTLYYFSHETSQKFLYQKYKRFGHEEAFKKSYSNCRTYIFYLEQGKSFFQQAQTAPENIQPILIFYGLTFILKATLLTIDPDYPATTAVLAHGVSTRKRKKQNYDYFQDEVKIQKYGLFPYFSRILFQIRGLEGEKYTIRSLLMQIPELHHLFHKWEKEMISLPVKRNNDIFVISHEILDCFNMTAERFRDYLQQKTGQVLTVISTHQYLQITFPNWKNNKPAEMFPFRLNIKDHTYYLTKERSPLSFLPEILIHYLLLYHLSMLARYEIEKWSELIQDKEGFEYPIIRYYLQISSGKCLYLLSDYLSE